MINELINGPQLAGAAAVACSDLLGVIFPPTETGLWVLRFMMLCECIVLYLCVRILIECYRDREKPRGKNKQRNSEPNNAPSGDLGNLRNTNLQCRLGNQKIGTVSNLSSTDKPQNLSWCARWVKKPFRFLGAIGGHRHIFGSNHKLVAMTPNAGAEASGVENPKPKD
jgi:hypothetical protein